ncbi:MAG: NAD-dependent epimerase/dehydratase family protein [Cyclobacteriaceae bacterium]
MKILITGSRGHLGEALVRVLGKTEHEIVGTDLLPSEFTDKVGSIVDRSFVDQLMPGVNVVLHAATLHKPHIVTHSYQDFIDTNISGTYNLLEAARKEGVDSFIFTSTTSTFGDAMRPSVDEPAVWVTEDVVPVPKNIYGVTKVAAEDLCQIFHRNHELPCIILRTSRFFPEDDDNINVRNAFEEANAKANELLYRRVDIEDVVSAHVLAIKKAREIGFARYIISATTPFSKGDLPELRANASKVIARIYPEYEALYKSKGWSMFHGLGRVYINEKARTELGWRPKYDFAHVLETLKSDKDFRSELAIEIGAKGYHGKKYKDGIFPV